MHTAHTRIPHRHIHKYVYIQTQTHTTQLYTQTHISTHKYVPLHNYTHRHTQIHSHTDTHHTTHTDTTHRHTSTHTRYTTTHTTLLCYTQHTRTTHTDGQIDTQAHTVHRRRGQVNSCASTRASVFSVLLLRENKSRRVAPVLRLNFFLCVCFKNSIVEIYEQLRTRRAKQTYVWGPCHVISLKSLRPPWGGLVTIV